MPRKSGTSKGRSAGGATQPKQDPAVATSTHVERRERFNAMVYNKQRVWERRTVHFVYHDPVVARPEQSGDHQGDDDDDDDDDASMTTTANTSVTTAMSATAPPQQQQQQQQQSTRTETPTIAAEGDTDPTATPAPAPTPQRRPLPVPPGQGRDNNNKERPSRTRMDQELAEISALENEGGVKEASEAWMRTDARMDPEDAEAIASVADESVMSVHLTAEEEGGEVHESKDGEELGGAEEKKSGAAAAAPQPSSSPDSRGNHQEQEAEFACIKPPVPKKTLTSIRRERRLERQRTMVREKLAEERRKKRMLREIERQRNARLKARMEGKEDDLSAADADVESVLSMDLSTTGKFIQIVHEVATIQHTQVGTAFKHTELELQESFELLPRDARLVFIPYSTFGRERCVKLCGTKFAVVLSIPNEAVFAQFCRSVQSHGDVTVDTPPGTGRVQCCFCGVRDRADPQLDKRSQACGDDDDVSLAGDIVPSVVWMPRPSVYLISAPYILHTALCCSQCFDNEDKLRRAQNRQESALVQFLADKQAEDAAPSQLKRMIESAVGSSESTEVTELDRKPGGGIDTCYDVYPADTHERRDEDSGRVPRPPQPISRLVLIEERRQRAAEEHQHCRQQLQQQQQQQRQQRQQREHVNQKKLKL